MLDRPTPDYFASCWLLVTKEKKISLYQVAGKTMLTFSISVNVLSANFLFCVVPAGREGGGNRKYIDVSGKC